MRFLWSAESHLLQFPSDKLQGFGTLFKSALRTFVLSNPQILSSILEELHMMPLLK
jgi:hypothetical protein